MSIINLAAEIFMKKVGVSGNTDNVISALTTLFSGGGGDIDLMGLVSKFQSGGMASLASSWLGDGNNEPISTNQVKDVLGESNISEFSSKLGINTDTALQGLSSTIPELIDQSSSGGSLLDNVGGLGGIADMAKKLF